MKFSLFAVSVLATVLATAPVVAQSEAKEATLAVPTAAEAVRPAADSPQGQVDVFFRLLTEGRVDAAYDGLLKGTKILEMPKDVETLKTNTRKALKAFGDLNGYDQVSLKPLGSRLCCLTCISLGKAFPIRWRFYFYKAEEKWKLIDIRIDDRLVDMFEEPAPAAAAKAK